jgi:hypothetical protein
LPPSPTALKIFTDDGDSAEKYKMAVFKPGLRTLKISPETSTKLYVDEFGFS